MYLFIPREQLSLKRGCPPSRDNQEEEKVSDLKVTKVSGDMCNEFQGVCFSFLRLLSKIYVVVVTAGACFSKVPKLFGRISCHIILFVSSKRRRLEARNFAVTFLFIPFTTYEKTSFTE